MTRDHIVVGGGEVGKALYEVLSSKYRVWVVDTDLSKCILHKDAPMNPIEVLHIAIPPSKHFDRIVKDYQKEFKPTYTVIHSSVPLGTSRKLGAFHSPVRGVHPHLAEGLRTFVKYLAPRNPSLADTLLRAGFPIVQVEKPETTEAMKLWDTTQYGWNIILEKLIYEWCKEHDVDFDVVYTDANRSYNAGYRRLSLPQYSKYVLKHVPGPVGGHCVLPNLELFKSPINGFIKQHNARLSMPRVSKAPRKGKRRGNRRS